MSSSLPIKRDLSKVFRFTRIIATLVIIASAISLIFPTIAYPDEEIRQSFLTNDAVNLLVAPLILLGSLWLAKRNNWVGLLALPGALIYVFYNAIANLFGMPIGLSTVGYLLIVSMSASTAFDLVKSIDREAVTEKLNGIVPRKFSGWVLAILGTLFVFRAATQLAAVFAEQQAFSPEISSDLIVSPLWIIGGILLLRNKPFGYVSGFGLLFSASMLFIGLLIFFILEPFISGVPFRVEDFVVILTMGMICFVPTILYWRGIMKEA